MKLHSYNDVTVKTDKYYCHVDFVIAEFDCSLKYSQTYVVKWSIGTWKCVRFNRVFIITGFHSTSILF